MSDEDFGLSRRKLLGAIGGVGATGALGGAATTSLLWDEEKFGTVENPNVMQAGALDLKVDYEEHYADWKGSETDIEGVRMVDSADEIQEGEVGLPTPGRPMLAVDSTDTDGDGTSQIEEFMDATTIESSDTDGDGDPDLVDQPGPVVTLTDVKPGDFGEVTLSYHIFDNPGFARVCAEEIADSDNGISEPEDKVNGHDPDDSDGTEGGDLGEYLMAQAWYDPNCNNRFDGGEVEMMLVTDVSESMTIGLPGAPNVDGDTGDETAAGDNTALEAVKAAVGSSQGNGFLRNVDNSCGDSVEVGSVSAATNLNHLDDLSDGDDSGAGFDGADLGANLDKGLTSASDSALMNLYGGGQDFSPDFTTPSPVNGGNYEAERPYTEDGGSDVPEGVTRAQRALLPDGFVSASSGLTGIDPTGNAALPGDARKFIVVFTDGAFAEGQEDPINFAEQTALDAEADQIDVVPVITNPDPKPQDVEFGQALANFNNEPFFATHYGPGDDPGSCPPAIQNDPEADCTSLVEAMQSLRASVCASAGGERMLTGPAPITDVVEDLSDCTLLDPVATGSARSEQYGGACHEPSNTGCIALAWWLPRDLEGVNDNIIQTDRYEFTVGFEAVQCRHNTNEEGEPIEFPGDADAGADPGKPPG